MEITPIGISHFRGREIKFGIKREDRRRHMYIIGKTGSGKTTLIENLIFYDINSGEGLGYLDPHGDSVVRILSYIPKERLEDVIYFDPSDLNYPISFNPLENVSYESRHIIASSILSVMKKIWVDAWSARMEYILLNTLLSLLEYQGATLLDINRLLGDDSFRNKVVSNLKDPIVKNFWEKEFAKYHANFRTEAIAPIQNKVGQFISSPLIRNIIGQEKSSFDLRKIMDERKIFLANLSKGKLGEENSMLLGGLLITKFQLTAMSRVDVPEEERPDFYLYIDEFQNFATESFVNILSEARKYRLNLILSHQYLDQVPESIIKAVFGNVGNMIVFRCGSLDAEIFSKEFIEIQPYEFINIPKYHIYARLIVDGIITKPFMGITYGPKPLPEVDYVDEIMKISRFKYAKHRKIVESKIFAKYQESRKEKIKLIECAQCHQEFWVDEKMERNICYECEERGGLGICLSSLESKNFNISLKGNKQNHLIREENDEKIVENLLKKLINE
ncbi:MAG: type IV secretory system conjugative DNA transfer family protein [Patescibacteria group bacterium]|nr:type IV secretory system conjugative DNA transfer family protein [Patescibacteria group bacterium]